MNYTLRDKYGFYNDDGYWISDPELWDYYAQNPKAYKKKKRLAWLWFLIPIIGIIGYNLAFEQMGLSAF